MKAKIGFTLVEVMIVVAIIGLLAAVGIPSVIGALKQTKIRAKTRNIQDVMRAKGMCTLPSDMGGLDAETGDDVSSDICSYLNGVSTLSDLDVGGDSITIGNIGTIPTY